MAVAIVTGAGGDIGRAITKGLLEAGYTVLAADINLEVAKATAEALGAGAVPFQCDITSPESAARMAEAAAALGPLGLLVNNAGGITDASLHETSIENWRKDLSLNLDGALICFKAVEAQLIANRGNVVNIASVNGFGVFGHPGYSAAKAALVHFTKLLAVEYGKHGIRANAVAPGTVQTQAWQARADANPNVMAEARRWYPLQRVARPEDIANAVQFLASDKASAISGICLVVDCGLMAGQTELAGTFSQSPDY
jgi:NAD(P)-dependent dehydrogenase (short-subunit alcohol dehydrogenase family)